MYSTRKILRLCSQDFMKYKQFRASTSVENDIKHENTSTKGRKVDILYDKFKGQIMFNSYLESGKLRLGYFAYYKNAITKAKKLESKEFNAKSLEPLPLALQYVVDKDKLLTTDEQIVPEEVPKTFQLPFRNKNTFKYTNNETIKKHSQINKWMTSYEHFDDSMLEEDGDDDSYEWAKVYGTPDPESRVSGVPCGGCGALLHSSEPSIPGYLPSEIFKGRLEEELRGIECQRCHFLKEYNIALDISVQPQEYAKLLQSIRNVKSLVVMMVDLLDFPCSIWPGIVDIIGTDRPLFIVGNKVDLIPGDSVGYLKRIEQSLISETNKTKLKDANIKYMSLISAKTGYGVEDLISAMFKLWLYKGDVFLVGCTNVGKSSLFNALLQSDYCKVHAVDIMKRATVSRWPGTTLNLLKFPINRPSGWKIYARTQRINSEKKLLQYENEIRKGQLEKKAKAEIPSIMGHIGRTFADYGKFKDDYHPPKGPGLNQNDKVFANSKWFYDTPGVIHPDQTLSLLTTEELLLTIPKEVIKPQTYYLHKGTTILIGGLARLDFVDCSETCRFTIFCSNSLPITITKTEDADVIYDTFLGTELLGAPSGGKERLDNWPGLKKIENSIEFTGEGPKLCCGDIVLSSIAWVAVTSKKGSICKVDAWSPEGRGVHVRKPSLLPFSINMKGTRIRDTPAYKIGKIFVEDEY